MTKLHHYKNYTFEKPEGSEYWNVWLPMNTKKFGTLWNGYLIGFGKTLKECRNTVEMYEG